MKMSKRDFMMGAGFVGMAGLAETISASSSEKAGALSPSVFNVREFGAKGDGETPDSKGGVRYFFRAYLGGALWIGVSDAGPSLPPSELTTRTRGNPSGSTT